MNKTGSVELRVNCQFCGKTKRKGVVHCTRQLNTRKNLVTKRKSTYENKFGMFPLIISLPAVGFHSRRVQQRVPLFLAPLNSK